MEPSITDPMLASPVAVLPGSTAMQGGSAYEPKWDGYRGLVHRTDDGCRLVSRNGNDLTDCFSDIAAAICSQLPADAVVDGELVVWRGDRIDFTALGERLTAPRRCPDLARAFPATFMAFDVLRLEGVDLTRQPLHRRGPRWRSWPGTGASRRGRCAAPGCPPLQLTPQTTDVEVAQRWLQEYADVDVGVEGWSSRGSGRPTGPGRVAGASSGSGIPGRPWSAL